MSRRAVDWLVALQAPDATAATRQDFEHWCAADPDHLRAWRHIESFQTPLRALPAPLARAALVRDPAPRRAANRRQVLRVFATLAVTGSGLWLARQAQPWEDWSGWTDWRADYRSATGERRTLTLEDGTEIVLNSNSAINARFDDQWRTIELVRGEILVTSAHDPLAGGLRPPRPLVVDTSHGRLQPLGTRFSVRQFSDHTQLAVFDGAVEIRPAAAASKALVLHAGEQTDFDRRSIAPPTPVAAPGDAWVSGFLVAHDMALGDFVAELARYRRGRLACDPALQGLRVSGVYPLADTDRVLDMLARTQPIRVQRLTRFWVTVQPRLARGD